MKVSMSRIIAIGVPLVLTVICLVAGYTPDQNSIPLVIMGWGSLFLTILVVYHEWYNEEFLKAIKQSHSYEVMQQKYVPVLMQIEALVSSVEKGEEIFSTATFPLSEDYEIKLVKKVVELAEAQPSSKQTIFTRIISNASNSVISDWIKKIRDPQHPVYSKLHKYIQDDRVKIYTRNQPAGLDLLMIAGERRKIVLIGVKEESPDQYSNNYFAKLISRGNTFVFQNDDMADSIYNYYGKFICTYLETNGRRLSV